MRTFRPNDTIQHTRLVPLGLDAVKIKLQRDYGSGCGRAVIDTFLHKYIDWTILEVNVEPLDRAVVIGSESSKIENDPLRTFIAVDPAFVFDRCCSCSSRLSWLCKFSFLETMLGNLQPED